MKKPTDAEYVLYWSGQLRKAITEKIAAKSVLDAAETREREMHRRWIASVDTYIRKGSDVTPIKNQNEGGEP